MLYTKFEIWLSLPPAQCRRIQNWKTSHNCIFHIIRYFTTKRHNFTKFMMDFFDSKVCLKGDSFIYIQSVESEVMIRILLGKWMLWTTLKADLNSPRSLWISQSPSLCYCKISTNRGRVLARIHRAVCPEVRSFLMSSIPQVCLCIIIYHSWHSSEAVVVCVWTRWKRYLERSGPV